MWFERLHVGMLFCVLVICGQATKVEVSGVVTGPDGVGVGVAAVEAISILTGLKTKVESDGGGRYQLVGLPAGRYRLTVSRVDFAVLQRELMLRVGDRVEVDLELRLQGAGERVEVSAEAPMPRATRGTVSFVVEQRKVVALPLDGRNFVPLIALSPGVNLPPGNLLPRINGSRPRVSEYIYDGISVLQPEPGQVAYYPVIDAIEEFRVEANSYSAEYGRSNGGVILVNQKSGGNEWHGTLFEFFRNEKLNARNLFSSGGAKPVFRRNQYGFVVGGPVRKNQTFVFGDWQGTRLATGVVRTSTVPTEAQKRGEFGGGVFDPLTSSQSPFAGGVVPLSRMDPVAVSLLKRYPMATLVGAANNYRRVANETTAADQWDGRVDHYFGSKQRVFARYAYLRDASLPAAPLPDGGGLLTAGVIGDTATRADSVALEHSWNVSATRVNQLRFGFTRRRFERASMRGQRDGTTIPNLVLSSFSDVLPTFDVVGFQQLGPTASGNAEFTTSVTQLIDNLAWVRGGHSLKVGFDLRWERLDVLQPSNPTGNFQFTNVFTGNSFASFLLGQVGRYSADAQAEVLKPRAGISEFFVQDDWRVSRRLTLNLGLRYTLNHPSRVEGDKTAVFDLAQQKLVFGGAARQLEKLDFAPRLGLAYQLGHGFVVRGGYGMTWIEQAGITTPFTNPLFPFVQTVGEQSLDNLRPAFALSSGPTVRLTTPNADSGLGQGVFGVQRDNGSGYAQQWNLSLQRSIGNDWSVEAGYLGSKLTRLGVPDVNLNQLTVEQLRLDAQLTQQVANPLFGIVPVTSSLGGATIARGQLLRPYPQFTTVSLYRNNVGHSTYHSVQARVEKRFSQRLTFTAAYTFSKLIDDAGAVFDSAVLTGPAVNFQAADSFNKRLEKDVSTGNVSHNFSSGFVYELPWGIQVAGIARRQSGSPVAVTQATNLNAFAGFGVQRPNRIGSPLLPEYQRGVGRWFDTGAFTQAPQFTIGNSSRNPVVGPRYSTLDVMVGKTFLMREGLKLEMRAEAFNTTNTPPLGNPNGSFGNAAFGTITTALDPRVFEFVLKVRF